MECLIAKCGALRQLSALREWSGADRAAFQIRAGEDWKATAERFNRPWL
jgi:hypothetical protein